MTFSHDSNALQIYFGISTPFSSLSLFTPSITQGLGYSDLRAQLMTVPPYAVAYVVTVAVAWSADYFNRCGLQSYHIPSINLTMLQSRPTLSSILFNRRNGVPGFRCASRTRIPSKTPIQT